MTKKPNFLRRTWRRYAKLGKGVKKNQKWRRPTGRDNKMREKRKGRPAVVSVGYINNKKDKKEIILVKTLKELEKVKEGTIILGKIGNKKKIEIAKKAKEKGIKISNLNVEKFLKKLDKNKPLEKVSKTTETKTDKKPTENKPLEKVSKTESKKWIWEIKRNLQQEH